MAYCQRLTSLGRPQDEARRSKCYRGGERHSRRILKGLNVRIGDGLKEITPIRFYRALVMTAISAMPEEELPALEKAIRWA